MALADEVTARYPNTRLVQLTRPGQEEATSVDTTFLGYAVTDVEADFLDYCATTYDNTKPQHVNVAVEGVIAKLKLRGEAAGTDAESSHERYIARLKDLARVTGRDRITPKTKSVLTSSSEQVGTETVRPDTDREHFDSLIPNEPR